MTLSSGQRTILFLGTHGQFNIGDELLLHTFLGQLGDSHDYRINSYNPAWTRNDLDSRVRAEVFDTAGSKLDLLRHLWASDVVVFGGGSIVKELYPTVPRWRYATLTMVLGMVLLARLLRKPVLMSNVGVGPVRHRFGKLLARLALRSTSMVAVRDAASLALCEELGCKPNRLRQVPDAVFVNHPGWFSNHPGWVSRPTHAAASITPEQAPAGGHAPTREHASAQVPALAEAGLHERRPLRIALNLNRDIRNTDNWSRFLEDLGDGLEKLRAERPIEIHTLPMQCGFKEVDDAAALEEFFSQRETLDRVDHRPDSHITAAEIIAECDVVVSERFHALVMAAVLGVPSVAIAYDVKVTELANDLDIPVIDINEPFDPQALVDAITYCEDNRLEIGGQLAAAAAERRATLDGYFDDVRRWIAGARPATRRWSGA